MVKQWLWAITAMVCVTACKVDVVVDNPTDSTLKVTVDGQKLTLEPKSGQTIQLPKKEVEVSGVRNGETFKEMVVIEEEGILNPSLSTYVVDQSIYTEDAEAWAKHQDKLQTEEYVELNGLVYKNVAFEVYDALFFPKAWDVGLYEDWPEEVALTKQGYAIVGKVFREEDLRKQYVIEQPAIEIDPEEMETDEAFNAWFDSIQQNLENEVVE